MNNGNSFADKVLDLLAQLGQGWTASKLNPPDFDNKSPQGCNRTSLNPKPVSQGRADLQAHETYLLQPPLSRRAFLGLTAGVTGMLAFDSFAPGAVMYAYADDDLYGVAITVLSKEEVGVIVRDVNTGNVLQDVDITITSFFNNKQIVAKTNHAGAISPRILDLAENGTVADESRYEFWGTLSATKKDYRDYEVGKVRFVSGPPVDKKGVQVPLQKTDSNAYARLISYDGYDIQYAITTIPIASYNDAIHTIRLIVCDSRNREVTAALFHNDTQIAQKTARAQNGYAQFSFEGYYNRDFQAGKQTKIRFTIDNQVTEVLTKLICEKNEHLQDSPEGNIHMSIGGKAGDSYSGWSLGDPLPGYSIVVPREFPAIGGTKFDLDLPMFPVYAYFSPFGQAVVTTNFDDLTLLKRNDGKWDAGERKFITKESYKKYLERREDAYSKAVQRHTDAKNDMADKKGKTGSAPAFGNGWKLKFSFGLLAMLDFKWFDSNSSGKWEGSVLSTAGLALKYDINKQFIVGVIPVFVGFDFAFSTSFIATVAVAIEGFFKSINWSNKTGMQVKIRIEIGVSVGIGIAGFISFSVRGYGYLMNSISFVVPEGTKPFPHIEVEGGLGVGYTLQVLFFKQSGIFYNTKWPKIYDNWGTGNVADPEITDTSTEALPGYPEYGTPTSGPLVGDGDTLASDWEIITEETLFALAEFDGTYADNEEPASYVLNEYGKTEVVTGADCSALDILDPESSSYDIAEGIRPKTEQKILGNTFSDPRTKFVQVGNDLYLLRIALVNVSHPVWPNGLSSRVVITKFDGSTWGAGTDAQQVIDFRYPNDDPTHRYWVYDYDFEVVAAGGKLHIVLISGTRPNKNSTTMEEARNHMLGSYIVYNPSTQKVDQVEHYLSAYDKKDVNGRYYSLNFPRVCVTKQGSTDVVCALWVVNRFQTIGWEPTAQNDFEVLWRNPDGTPNVSGVQELSGVFTGNVLDFQISAAPETSGAATVMFAEDDWSDDSKTSRNIDIMTFNSNKEIGMPQGSLRRNSGYALPHPDGGFIVPLPQHNLNPQAGLVHLRWQGSSQPLLSTVLGPVPEKPFALSADGGHLLTTEILEGTLPVATSNVLSDEVETLADQGTEEVKRYQVLASKIFQGTTCLSEFYPLAQLSNPIDSLRSTSFVSSSTGFVYSTITDLDKAKSDIYFASVPLVKSLQLDGVTSREDFVGPKDTAHLVLNVQNTGNLGVAGFTARLCTDKAGNNKVCDLNIGSLKDTLVLSMETYDVESDEMVVDAADTEGVLLPGRSRLYLASFVVPESWHGTIDLYVFLEDVQEARLGSDFPIFGEDIADSALMVSQMDNAYSPLSLFAGTETDLETEIARNDYATWLLGDEDPKDGDPMPKAGDDPGAVLLAALAAALGLGAVGLSQKKLSDSSSEDKQE